MVRIRVSLELAVKLVDKLV